MRPLIKYAISSALCLYLSCVSAATPGTSPQVTLQTDFGEILIELYPAQAPITVANFLNYVDSRFYDGTIFHRVKKGFVVQGGGLTFDFVKKPNRDPIKNESNNGLKNLAGTLAMARYSEPDSASSQFFFNLVNNEHLNAKPNQPGYAVFAKVIKGFAVVEKIAQQPTGLYRAYPEAPNTPIRILTARRVNTTKAALNPVPADQSK